MSLFVRVGSSQGWLLLLPITTPKYNLQSNEHTMTGCVLVEDLNSEFISVFVFSDS